MEHLGDQSFTINAGIQARYRISKRFDINVEYQGAILDDDMVVRGGFPNDGISGLTAGVTFRFGKTGFKKGYSSTLSRVTTLIWKQTTQL